MKVYCACEPSGVLVISEGTVVLGAPMVIDSIGVEQYLSSGERHYPNVDVRVCPNCGRKVVIE